MIFHEITRILRKTKTSSTYNKSINPLGIFCFRHRLSHVGFDHAYVPPMDEERPCERQIAGPGLKLR